MKYPKNHESALKWDYKFWNTQPVIKLNEKVNIDGQIESSEIVELNTVPFNLPSDFEWCKFDLANHDNCIEVAEFLDKHYVEDNDNEFRLQYKPEFIEWLYKKSQHIAIGVRMKSKNIIVAFVCGKVGKYQVNKNKLDMVDVNLLCVHKSLRNKRLVPVLVKELSRQFNLLGYSKALYNASNYLPTPILTANYFHRALNVKVLCETGFVKVDETTNYKAVKKANRLPEKFSNKNFKKIEEKHLEQMYELFNTYMGKYNLHPIFTQEEFSYLFYGNKFVVCYVLEDEEGNVLDFISYYVTQSSVLKNNEKYKYIKKANLFYYTSLTETPYNLIKDIMIVARNNSMDVFNATDIMENNSTVRELGFEDGTGTQHYYLYNWKIKPLQNIQCSLILM